MPETEKNLGRPLAVHGIAPAYLQRAVFIVVLSFLFFLAMMFAYYIRQSLVYFLLASAFLVLYVITLFSFVIQKRSPVEVFEQGLKFKKASPYWSEIAGVSDDGAISLTSGKTITLPKTLNGLDALVRHIRQKIGVS
ncbi:MAG: hypothetical protein ABJB40_05080 [Acidobacteriota bacterium]